MKFERAIVRQLQKQFMQTDDEYVIFFNDRKHIPCFLESWIKDEGHGDATLDFYYSCLPVNKEKAQEVINEYCKLYDCGIVLRQKLSFKGGN